MRISNPGQRCVVFHLVTTQSAIKAHQRTRSAPSIPSATFASETGVPASSLPALAATGTAAASSTAASSSGSRRTRATKRQREEIDPSTSSSASAGVQASAAVQSGPADAAAGASPSRRAPKRGRTAGMIQDEEPCEFSTHEHICVHYIWLCFSGAVELEVDEADEPAQTGDTHAAAASSIVPAGVRDIDFEVRMDANYFHHYAPELYASLKRLEVSFEFCLKLVTAAFVNRHVLKCATNFKSTPHCSWLRRHNISSAPHTVPMFSMTFDQRCAPSWLTGSLR